jgi:hypothetical protein
MKYEDPSISGVSSIPLSLWEDRQRHLIGWWVTVWDTFVSDSRIGIPIGKFGDYISVTLFVESDRKDDRINQKSYITYLIRYAWFLLSVTIICKFISTWLTLIHQVSVLGNL